MRREPASSLPTPVSRKQTQAWPRLPTPGDKPWPGSRATPKPARANPTSYAERSSLSHHLGSLHRGTGRRHTTPLRSAVPPYQVSAPYVDVYTASPCASPLEHRDAEAGRHSGRRRSLRRQLAASMPPSSRGASALAPKVTLGVLSSGRVMGSRTVNIVSPGVERSVMSP